MQEKKGLGRRWKIQSDTRPEGEGKGRYFKSFGESITIRYLVASPPKLQHAGTLVVFRIKRNRGSLSRNFQKKSLPLVVRKSIIDLSMNIFRENLFRFDFEIKYYEYFSSSWFLEIFEKTRILFSKQSQLESENFMMFNVTS